MLEKVVSTVARCACKRKVAGATAGFSGMRILHEINWKASYFDRRTGRVGDEEHPFRHSFSGARGTEPLINVRQVSSGATRAGPRSEFI
eukprot:917949-Rhodomonas_salina.1